MTACERQIRLSEAQDGMQLARPVGATTGPILISEGAILDSKSIASLNRRGIQKIWITNSGTVSPSAQDNNVDSRHADESRLNQLFRQSTGIGDGVFLLELLKRYKGRNPS
jgi:hypothetical protein